MTDIESLIFYLLFFIVSTIFIYLGAKKRLPWQLRKLFVAIGILIPTLISGLRGSTIGTDTPEYIRMYSGILAGQFDTPIEPITTLVVNIAGTFTTSSWLFFSLFALITASFYYLAISKIDKKYAWFMWIIYLFVYFTFSFNIVRQMAAVSILFYAIVQLASGNKRAFLLWAIVAACTHAVSIVAAVIFYVFYKLSARKPFSRNKIILISLATATLLGAFAGNIERIAQIVPLPIFQKVLDNATGDATLSIANAVFYLGVTFMMLVFYKRIQPQGKIIALLAVGMAIGSILVFLDSYLKHAGRLAYFFVVPALPIILYAMLMLTSKWRKVTALVLIVLAVFLFIATRFYGDGSDVIPYYTIFTSEGRP